MPRSAGHLYVRLLGCNMNIGQIFLILAAVVCTGAAMLHFACIPWGAEGYRFLGAGDTVVNAVAAGDWKPHMSALVVGTLLLVAASYALSGAGLIKPLPFLPYILFGVSTVLLVRAIAFPLLRPMFPGNTEIFWLVSSGLVGLLGLLFFCGALLATNYKT